MLGISAAVERGIAKKKEVATITEMLRWRAEYQPNRRAFTFLTDGEFEEVHLTYAELDLRARAVAEELLFLAEPGDRVLLIYPDGLDFVIAFFGCLYAGLIGVPTYAPDPARVGRTIPRLRSIARNCNPRLILATQPGMSMRDAVAEHAPEFAALPWFATDTFPKTPTGLTEPLCGKDDIAYLQYTSGSTGDPKGVVITHRNILSNQSLLEQGWCTQPDSTYVGWVPVFHDLGLILGVIHPVYGGFHSVMMAPASFVQRPARWLEAIARHPNVFAGGPNFAFALCARKVKPEVREQLDLSSWDLAFATAEPVRHATLDHFRKTFEESGFRPSHFRAQYGMAEATLVITEGEFEGRPRSFESSALDFDIAAEARVEEREEEIPVSNEHSSLRSLVCNGAPMGDAHLIVVDPESLRRKSNLEVGEFWVAGNSVAAGYWDNRQATQETFEAYTSDTGEGPFLRTGDLGFIRNGDAYAVGRRKDVIIIRGRNYAPQDIEETVDESHPAVRPGCCIAFSVDGEETEELVVVQEIDPADKTYFEDVLATIGRAIAETHQLRPHAVLLIGPRELPKTSSGQLKRRECRSLFSRDALQPLADSRIRRVYPPVNDRLAVA